MEKELKQPSTKRKWVILFFAHFCMFMAISLFISYERENSLATVNWAVIVGLSMVGSLLSLLVNRYLVSMGLARWA